MKSLILFLVQLLIYSFEKQLSFIHIFFIQASYFPLKSVTVTTREKRDVKMHISNFISFKLTL